MDYYYRIFDFHVYSETSSSVFEDDDDNSMMDFDEEDEAKKQIKRDETKFMVQIFGVNETGKTCSIIVDDFKPFFYVMVGDHWTIETKERFLRKIKAMVGPYYEKSITDCKIIERKKLYGFDNGKKHKFVRLEFQSMNCFNKVKNFWHNTTDRSLLKHGFLFEKTETRLYEANILPLLRFFHINEISPSGWIKLPAKQTVTITKNKRTSCEFEHIVCYKHIIACNEMEVRVPFKIMSFDIEASSSHGDFPVPIKSYKKLATNIVDYFNKRMEGLTRDYVEDVIPEIILAAFGFCSMQEIDVVYSKKKPSKELVGHLIQTWCEKDVQSETSKEANVATIEKMFLRGHHANDDEEEETGINSEFAFSGYQKTRSNKSAKKQLTVLDLICDRNVDREQKINDINVALCDVFPRLEGDKVTFIGSTFMYYGNSEPHFNHCIALNTCDPVENAVIESYMTEKEVLLAWQDLVQRENPDIIIGYNIFGFDYEFLFRRAQENNCVSQFLKLSRNKDEVCATLEKSGEYKIEETSIQIASGQHDLKFIKITGRLQVDLYNFFRREENLTSYKLDYVAGHFIGDYVKNLSQIYTDSNDEITEIKTKNMTGLLEGSFIHIEEIGHSVDYYAEGAKFLVTNVNKKEGKFYIQRHIFPDLSKKVRWCLAKDDVTPKDIFQMTNGSSGDRAVIAKYCIQDCNLVNYLFNKADILTGFIEMAKICSVPINFLVMRGQGIKLTSYIAKKCREKKTLMPVIEKGDADEGYEGAIVLKPKCDLYLDNPVACVDYASLYPSSMISENLSHDSKVWTKEYDLSGNLIEEWGDKDADGNFIYDNLPGREYVDVVYDTFKYVRKHPTAAAEKILTGRKICRFDQEEAIMPSILKELLTARKTTRKLIPFEKDEFMKNVLDKRQLGYKVTANSLYGGTGAKTSSFYEKDIAACTTSTGRKLLTYAKKIIEQCYGNNICQTENYGPVCTKAEYIYGDTGNYFSFFVSFLYFI